MHQPSTDAPHDRMQTCAAMTATSDPVANWASLFSTAKCNSFDPQTAVEGLSLVIPNANRAWFWQTCLEFGWLKPSYPGTSIFWGEVTLENLLAGCQAVFGIPNMTPYDRPLDDDSLRARADDAPIADSDTEWTNTFYGGYNLLGSNIMFSNGLKGSSSLPSLSLLDEPCLLLLIRVDQSIGIYLDPWHLVSISSNVPAPSSVQAVTYSVGHCATLIAATPQDPPSLTAARQTIITFLSNVLQPNATQQ